MRRAPAATLFALLLTLVIPTSIVRSAEPECAPAADGAAPANRPLWGTVTKASPDAITIVPEIARKRDAEPPAEQTFALAKDKTEFAFSEVGMAHRIADGTMLRTLNDPERAAADDVQAGQLVQVTPGEAGAQRVIIVWSVRGTIVKVNADSIVFRPAPAAPNADAAKKDAAAAAADADDESLTIANDTTRIRIAEVTGEGPSPNGRGRVTSVSYRTGTLADLKADQSVVVCIRAGAAARITIHATATATATAPKDAK